MIKKADKVFSSLTPTKAKNIVSFTQHT